MTVSLHVNCHVMSYAAKRQIATILTSCQIANRGLDRDCKHGCQCNQDLLPCAGHCTGSASSLRRPAPTQPCQTSSWPPPGRPSLQPTPSCCSPPSTPPYCPTRLTTLPPLLQVCIPSHMSVCQRAASVCKQSACWGFAASSPSHFMMEQTQDNYMPVS